MNKTVLVIGSVTADQYKDARLSVLENGHKPRIIRATFDEFFLDAEDLLEKVATEDEVAEEARRDEVEAPVEASMPLLQELAIRHYSSFGDIAAFVVDQEVWDMWDASSGGGGVAWVNHARLMQPDYAPRWVAYEAGEVEFVG